VGAKPVYHFVGAALFSIRRASIKILLRINCCAVEFRSSFPVCPLNRESMQDDSLPICKIVLWEVVVSRISRGQDAAK
jgi:hypothetical protein